uniref:AlNc14C316G10537 protein n=1 Tax=Albugo laibachii Nc14 TaxID=890382 RepID=F0WW99_9STRA|nr:AlNc14C316G10537 [Albugo laibachii Nc14]|eukprot:CCA25719.1 AlNc14C316G10537 [Albugo laibachii Nc14]
MRIIRSARMIHIDPTTLLTLKGVLSERNSIWAKLRLKFPLLFGRASGNEKTTEYYRGELELAMKNPGFNSNKPVAPTKKMPRFEAKTAAKDDQVRNRMGKPSFSAPPGGEVSAGANP